MANRPLSAVLADRKLTEKPHIFSFAVAVAQSDTLTAGPLSAKFAEAGPVQPAPAEKNVLTAAFARIGATANHAVIVSRQI